MTEEETQRKFDFIVEQLSKTVVGLEMMRESHREDYDKFDKRMSRLEGAFVGLYNSISENTKQITMLREESKEQKEILVETRERLDIFIVMLERYIAQRENDSSGNGDKAK